MTELKNHSCFVDSNIWLYAFSTDKKEETKRILAKQLIKEKSIIISTQIINEVSCNLLKKHKLDEKQLFKLIVSFYRKYQVISFNLDIFESASNLRTQYNLSFWDSLVIACASFSGANILYSEDMQDGLIVGDSALYSKENLKLMREMRWLSRVPFSIKEAQKLVDSEIPGYSWRETSSNYGGIEQRWLLVESQARQESDLKKLEKKKSSKKRILPKKKSGNYPEENLRIERWRWR
ncbi:hypothetical protein C789_4067 [Microcystis aeruginosa FACHB-905 = DIANCHI905]|uniref:PIN domain-containing protein n=2 Tax=Microcystis aeruginosa (strain PCC 7806) TaxID=267872 RepID=A0AB33BND0_MICA7|nr:hypothetical protein BH695_2009 [Microcystis aeruginosa PCC 7806SL]ELS46122.1 hypothetical protein C789_4067 [Microcystis aeruginosa FACHB-905 = DIANCHI905]CAO86694.1 unnamed protein product [Microcystis aeruginosa PCC 7806]